MESVGYFRIYRVEVFLDKDLGKDSYEVLDVVLELIVGVFGC